MQNENVQAMILESDAKNWIPHKWGPCLQLHLSFYDKEQVF